jgi:hypothetical protein
VKWNPEIAKNSETVKRIVSQYFLTGGKRKKKLSLQQEQMVRKELQQALGYLDQNAIELGDGSLDILKLLGQPYGRMAENLWLYPAEEKEHFYVLNFINDSVAKKYFSLMYDVETGR